MGEKQQNEDRWSLMQKTQAASDAKVAELGKQLNQLSLQLQELISGLNPSINKVSDGTASSNNHETHQRHRSNLQPIGEGQSAGGGTVPRFTKLEFPTFDGSLDPLIWLHRCDKFFSNQHTPEAEKVGLATFHMIGEAQLWSHQLEIEQPAIDWLEFKEACALRFGPPNHRNPLGELVNLKQRGSVEEYQRQFQELLARASKYIYKNQHVSLFTAGLIEPIRVEVELHDPPDLTNAMNVARPFEKKQMVLREATVRKGSWQDSGGSYSSTVSALNSQQKDTSSIGGAAGATPANSSNPYIKKLTRAEMAERRAKGLCYNCDDPFTIGHLCKKLFWLELADSDNGITVAEAMEPEISLHAITGQTNLGHFGSFSTSLSRLRA